MRQRVSQGGLVTMLAAPGNCGDEGLDFDVLQRPPDLLAIR